jgi:hypothetical protein
MDGVERLSLLKWSHLENLERLGLLTFRGDRHEIERFSPVSENTFVSLSLTELGTELLELCSS